MSKQKALIISDPLCTIYRNEQGTLFSVAAPLSDIFKGQGVSLNDLFEQEKSKGSRVGRLPTHRPNSPRAKPSAQTVGGAPVAPS